MTINKQAIRDTIVNFLIPIICIGLSGALFVAFIIPFIRSHKELAAEVEQTRSLRDQLSRKLDALNNLIDFKDAIDEHSGIVSEVLVSETKVPFLLTQVDTIAKESGLSVNKLSYSTSSAGGAEEVTSLEYVTVQLGIKGNRDQLITFFDTLENSARLVDVDTYRYAEQSDASSEVTSTIILKSPYLYVKSTAVTDDPITLDITSQDFLDMMQKIKQLKLYKSEIPIEIPAEEEEIELSETEVPETEFPEEYLEVVSEEETPL